MDRVSEPRICRWCGGWDMPDNDHDVAACRSDWQRDVNARGRAKAKAALKASLRAKPTRR